MKITKKQIKRIIKEEITSILELTGPEAVEKAKKAAGPGYAEYEKVKNMDPEDQKEYMRQKGREGHDKKIKGLEQKKDQMQQRFEREKKRNAHMMAWANKIMTKFPKNIKNAQSILMDYMSAVANDNHEEADKIAKTAKFQG